VTRADGPRRRLPAWAVAEGPFGIRLFDLGIVVLVIAATEINVITGSGPGAAGRVVAEERLRIARELHDTVAHSMATITVQAGSALHLLDSDAPARGLRAGCARH
jgi:signal transduction histidine kinase